MRSLILSNLFMLMVLSCFAQKQANIWYFGSQAGVDFNSGSPVALNNGQLNTYEGCSSIADANGSLLFYTDGITVWNSQHQIMANGTGLTGNSSSTQSALIVQQPGSPNLYYIFVIDVDFRYSIVDMTLNGGLGDITAKNVLILAGCNGEKQCGTYHANGFDIWIIMHGTGTDVFNAYLLSSTGLNMTPVSTALGLVHTSPYGQMKITPDGSKIAVGIYNTGFAMEMVDFDVATGVVSNNIAFPTTYNQCYGLEFSPNSQILYATSNPDNNIYQFDLNAGSAAAIIASGLIVGSTGTNTAAGMQLGPDGKVYLSPSGTSFLDAVNFPDSLGLGCAYTNNAVNLNGPLCNLGLPGFISSYFNQFNSINSCLGDSTFFNCGSVFGLGGAAWNFGDTASGLNNLAYVFYPVHYYSSAGTYQVELVKYFLNGNIDTIFLQVQINAPPTFSLGNDTTICSGGSILLNAGSGFSSYLWPDGSTDSTFLAVDSGTYVVQVTQGGCSGSDTVSVFYSPCATPGVALTSSDSVFCGKKCIDFFDLSTNSPTSWLWLFPGADSTSSTLQNPTNICYNSYGIFDVTLIACNAAGCDTLIIPGYIQEFQNPPVPVITSNFDTLFSTPAYSYQWCNVSGSIPGATGSFYVYQQQGLYYVIVTDSNGCAASSGLIYTGVEDMNGIQGSLTVAPNPSNGLVTVNLPLEFNDPSGLRVMDVLGRELYYRKLMPFTSSVQLNLDFLPDAVYFIQLVQKNRQTIVKFVLQH